jgi:hypothetical protein
VLDNKINYPMTDIRHGLAVVKDEVTAHTVSNLDAHLHSADASKSETVEEIYGFVRPLLLFVSGFLRFKPAWSHAIDSFVAVMDAEFPQSLPAEEEEEQDVDDDNQEEGVPGLSSLPAPSRRTPVKKAAKKKAAKKK